VREFFLALSFILFSSSSPAVESNLPVSWQKTSIQQNLSYESKSYTATRVYNKKEKKNTWLIIEKENNNFIGDTFDELFLYKVLAEFAVIKDYVDFHTLKNNKLVSLENKLDEIIATAQKTVYTAKLLESELPQQTIETEVKKLKALVRGLIIPTNNQQTNIPNYLPLITEYINLFKGNEKQGVKDELKTARKLALDKIKTATFDLKKSRLLLKTRGQWDYQTAHTFYELYKNALTDLASYSELYQNLQPALGWKGILQSASDGLLGKKVLVSPISLENALKSFEETRNFYEENLAFKINPPPNQQHDSLPFLYPFSTPIEKGFFIDVSISGASFELRNKKFFKYTNYGFNEEFCTIEASRSPEADGIQITPKVVFNNRDAEFFLYPLCYKNEEGKVTSIDLYLIHDFQFELKTNFTPAIRLINDYTKLVTIDSYNLSSARNSRKPLQLLLATEDSDVAISVSLR